MRKFFKRFFHRHKMDCNSGIVEVSFLGNELIFKDVYVCRVCGKKKIRTVKREKNKQWTN